MENEHAYRSGCVLLWRRRRRGEAGFSPINVTAAVAVLALVGVLGWQATHTISAGNSADAGRQYWGAKKTASSDAQVAESGAATAPENATNATSSDPNDFSQVGTNAFGELIGTYVTLKQSGAYTSAEGDRIASNIAGSLQADVAFAPYTQNDIATDPDTSFARMLKYRGDLRVALAPLLANSRNELEMFGHYVETRDANDLLQLKAVAGRYRKAAGQAAQARVPADAVPYHLAILNALLQFGATLDALAKNAGDSMATLALLRGYNAAEANLLTSFNSLASYEKRKIP